jgi:hypothetical protein
MSQEIHLTRRDAEQDASLFIHSFYNHRRRHAALGQRPPAIVDALAAWLLSGVQEDLTTSLPEGEGFEWGRLRGTALRAYARCERCMEWTGLDGGCTGRTRRRRLYTYPYCA